MQFIKNLIDKFPIESSIRGLQHVDYAIEAAAYCFIIGMICFLGIFLILREMAKEERKETERWQKILLIWMKKDPNHIANQLGLSTSEFIEALQKFINSGMTLQPPSPSTNSLSVEDTSDTCALQD